MRKSALVVEVCPKWASAWAGVNESIKTFNEGEAKTKGGKEKMERWSAKEGEVGVDLSTWVKAEFWSEDSSRGNRIPAKLLFSEVWVPVCVLLPLYAHCVGGALWLLRCREDDDSDGRFGCKSLLQREACTVLCIDIWEIAHPMLYYTVHSSFVVVDEQQTFSAMKCSNAYIYIKYI